MRENEVGRQLYEMQSVHKNRLVVGILQCLVNTVQLVSHVLIKICPDRLVPPNFVL